MEKVGTSGISMYVSYCVVPKISVQDSERGSREVCGGNNKAIMRMEESGCERNECTRGSCTYSGEYTSESIDIRVDGDFEGEDSDQIVQGLSRAEDEAILGESFLEQSILREHSGAG